MPAAASPKGRRVVSVDREKHSGCNPPLRKAAAHPDSEIHVPLPTSGGIFLFFRMKYFPFRHFFRYLKPEIFLQASFFQE